ncbi:MAG: sugar diacid recognition domain-containing protein [Gallicola sp.]|nr:sugar diacid recognition domain-containing protein [Gallicola sp.]
MKINKYAAQSIVDSMKEIISYDINFIDREGLIIASTDKNRIGQQHCGALLCINHKEDLFIYSDDQYKGSKKGINMLIHFDNEIIGVIGITGEPKRIEKYGQIIKKMTEILLYEDWYKTTKMKKKENIRISIEGLLLGNRTIGSNLYANTDTNNKNVITILWDSEEVEAQTIEKVYDKIFDLINFQKENYIAQFFNEIVIIVSSLDKDSLEYLVNSIAELIEQYGLFHIGVGSSYQNEQELRKSYKESKASLKWNAIYNNGTSVSFYDNLDLGLLFNNITTKDVENYILTITKNIAKKDLPIYHELILSYAAYNGQISKISKELFIHKNTVQYRLNRLYEITGYNPRNIVDFVKLYLAFSMLHLNDNYKRN